jgi:hypothetical protein
MNADAVSDLALALACAWACAQTLRTRPGIGVAAGLIGVAACLGVLSFSGVAALEGPHDFASLVAACAAFPLLAWALRWPLDPISTRVSAAGRSAALLAGVGVLATVAGLSVWGQVAPGAAALVILWTMLRAHRPVGLLGALLLVAAFVASLAAPEDLGRLGRVSHVQWLHYPMALALLALAHAAPARACDAPA